MVKERCKERIKKNGKNVLRIAPDDYFKFRTFNPIVKWAVRPFF
jgi:hypothetical protein